jgi:hypothetical protein
VSQRLRLVISKPTTLNHVGDGTEGCYRTFFLDALAGLFAQAGNVTEAESKN